MKVLYAVCMVVGALSMLVGFATSAASPMQGIFLVVLGHAVAQWGRALV